MSSLYETAGEKPFVCDTCKEGFHSSYTLSFHRRSAHPEEYPQKNASGEVIRLPCKFCNQVCIRDSYTIKSFILRNLLSTTKSTKSQNVSDEYKLYNVTKLPSFSCFYTEKNVQAQLATL